MYGVRFWTHVCTKVDAYIHSLQSLKSHSPPPELKIGPQFGHGHYLCATLFRPSCISSSGVLYYHIKFDFVFKLRHLSDANYVCAAVGGPRGRVVKAANLLRSQSLVTSISPPWVELVKSHM